jgi:hypothetical protein|tara:strand:+ start:16292 stop:16594 length:303 start_codon:yes stop_codon:yes gene_type:complete
MFGREVAGSKSQNGYNWIATAKATVTAIWTSTVASLGTSPRLPLPPASIASLGGDSDIQLSIAASQYEKALESKLFRITSYSQGIEANKRAKSVTPYLLS